PLAWAEDRALLRSNPSAVPGANTEWGGTMPPSAIRDWQQSDKPGLGPAAAASPALVPTIRSAPLFDARGCNGPALGVGRALAHHSPGVRGTLPHPGAPGAPRPPPPLEALEPPS